MFFGEAKKQVSNYMLTSTIFKANFQNNRGKSKISAIKLMKYLKNSSDTILNFIYFVSVELGLCFRKI